ncbi:MAG: hypothetical protein MdMp014T_0631 [Treponematales bacterium]
MFPAVFPLFPVPRPPPLRLRAAPCSPFPAPCSPFPISSPFLFPSLSPSPPPAALLRDARLPKGLEASFQTPWKVFPGLSPRRQVRFGTPFHGIWNGVGRVLEGRILPCRRRLPPRPTPIYAP